MRRDMTEKQYWNAIERAGGKSEGFLGYVCFRREDGANIGVSQLNYPGTRRHRLACLLRQRDKAYSDWNKLVAENASTREKAGQQ